MTNKSSATGNLTPKQERFVAEYVQDLNATQAAIRAGYGARNADKIGPRLVGNSRVSAAIQRALGDRAQRTAITADQVIHELACIAFAKMGDFVTWGTAGVKLTPSAELSKEDKAALQDVASTASGPRIRLHDKLKALELLGKHLGLWNNRDPADLLEIFLAGLSGAAADQIRKGLAALTAVPAIVATS